MTSPLRIALIIASTREGRFGPTVARWFETVTTGRTDIELTLPYPTDADLPAHWTPDLTPQARAFTEHLATCDAYIAQTPEYNHSFPASLKQAIDIAGPVWTRKPVGFISYGGLSGGLRAVEQLRPVFAELHAATIRETVSFHQFPFDRAGQPHDHTTATQAATTLLDDLAWWGHALRTARQHDQPRTEAA
ncbi:NADPH-dependent FMN reductase [Streptomyces sp. NPDC090036]|uniref:NADPH-dependent FMN reductase n=1 Tax=Streptomyces sp. NPDC090036 TaxID=3365926 RepID=UPI00380A463A